MTVWRNLSLTPTARALATNYAREVNTLYKFITITIDNLLLAGEVKATSVFEPSEQQAGINRSFMKGKAPGRLTGCEDNFAHLV